MEKRFINSPFFKNEENGSEEFSKLLEMFSPGSMYFKKGDIVKGTIVEILEDHCLIDLGYKTEGKLPIEQIAPEERIVGKEIEVKIEAILSDEQHVILSRKEILQKELLKKLIKNMVDETPVLGKIVKTIKGGFIVDIGIPSFLPGSLADPLFIKNPASAIGREIRLKILNIDEEKKNIVVSQKEFIENNHINITSEEDLYPGNIIKGYIKNITEYGVFLDLGGVDGLLHKTDISWGRVKHPADFFKIGEIINVMVLHYDETEGKVSLGYKQLTPDPWQNADAKYPQGTVVEGKIKSFEDYGIFVELEEGIEGLVHKSEISWEKVENPSEIFKIGDKVNVKIMGIDKNHRKISLSIKRAKRDPWFDFAKRHKKFSTLEGMVKEISPSEIKVELEPNILGTLKVSSIPEDEFKNLNIGENIEVSIIHINPYKHKLTLGLKKHESKKWEKFFANYTEGDILEGEITNITNFGLFIKLDDGIEALCHNSELERDLEEYKVGDNIKVKIKNMNLAERKIAVTTKELNIPLSERIKKQISSMNKEEN